MNQQDKDKAANRQMEEALKTTIKNCASNKMDIRILKNIDAAFPQNRQKNKNQRKRQKQNIAEISFL